MHNKNVQELFGFSQDIGIISSSFSRYNFQLKLPRDFESTVVSQFSGIAKFANYFKMRSHHDGVENR